MSVHTSMTHQQAAMQNPSESSNSRPGLTKTVQIGTAAFLTDARCVQELQGTHPEH